MARIVRMHGFGGPDVLVVDDIEVAAPQSGEVRIKVRAIGLNRAETLMIAGAFGELPLPFQFGYEAAGEIESVGPGVDGFRPGDRVALLPGLPPPYGACGELILAPVEFVTKTPDAQSDVEAAATWMQYLTAYAVRAYRPIEPGDAVVITAASSSVGLAAIQMVAVDGGVPIAVTRGRGKAEALIRHGAAHVIASSEQDVAATVREITGGRGAALALDAVAGEALPGILSALRQGGLAIVYGSLGGDPAQFSSTYLSFLDLTIKGFATNHLLADPQMRAKAVEHVRQNLAAGRFKPVVDRTFQLSEIREAYGYLLSNEQVGKVVVVP